MEALDGLLVADVSGTIATSYAAKLFADYGAEVWNFEPNDGFLTRRLHPFIPGTGESAMHGYLHANKRSVAGAAPDGFASFDLVIGDPTLSTMPSGETNTLVISWFGSTGSYTEFQGSDAVIQALIGQTRAIGTPEGPPIMPAGYEAQIIGGVTAYVGGLGHLLGTRLGNTQRFDLETSIFEASMCLTDLAIVHAYTEARAVPRLGINRFAPTYPLGIFPCKDGWLGVTVLSPAQWNSFCHLIGMDEFADVPLFQTSMSRLEAVDVIEPLMREKLLEFTAEELFYKGQAQRIPLARVPTMEELFSVDQFVERNAFSFVEQAGREFKAPSTPFRLFATPPRFGGKVAMLGEHNDAWQARVGAQ